MANWPEGWQEIARPPALFRRYEFANYAQTRRYLDLLAGESERTGRYPDLSFGPRHVNVTIALAAEDEALVAAFAVASDSFAEQARAGA
ncbi:MAG: 4a-hydroxytetrahydrobiopterin dehydratase [Casimicrobiaceae bacterium]|nr:4a-hydroxytetrahydrobiopterin dehydratase [Casimicrobiaceae bacterium]